MSNYYNLDGIKTELAKQISAAKTRLAAWEAVTFPTKKDGTPFKVMSKNISGASYEMQTYAMQPGEYIQAPGEAGERQGQGVPIL